MTAILGPMVVGLSVFISNFQDVGVVGFPKLIWSVFLWQKHNVNG